jgi:hypothetical protein
MWEQYFSSADPETAREALQAAAAIVILALANELAQCMVRTLHRIEAKLDRNTRETVRAARQAETAAHVAATARTAHTRAGDPPSTPQPDSEPTQAD